MSRTRFSKGVSTTLTSQQALSNYPGLDVTKTHEYFNDFDNYLSNAGEFTVTTVGSGSIALAAGDGGIINMATSAGATDSLVITKPVAGFGPVAGLEMWFETQLICTDATNTQIMCGMVNMLTTPFSLASITDGFFFNKPTAAALFNAYVRGSSVSQSLTAIGNSTAMVNATQIILGIYGDANGNFTFYINDNKVCTISTVAANFPAVNLTPFVAIQNGAAAIKTLSVDYLLAAKLRANS